MQKGWTPSGPNRIPVWKIIAGVWCYLGKVTPKFKRYWYLDTIDMTMIVSVCGCEYCPGAGYVGFQWFMKTLVVLYMVVCITCTTHTQQSSSFPKWHTWTWRPCHKRTMRTKGRYNGFREMQKQFKQHRCLDFNLIQNEKTFSAFLT